MLDKILKYIFECDTNTTNMCVYVCMHIQKCNEYELAQIIIDLRNDNEQLTKIIEYFKIY